MATQLPPGWTIAESIEQVPNPNNGTGGVMPYGFFARKTFICNDENSQFVCASGAEEDCNNQAQTAAQARTQQQPYFEAT